MPSARNKVFFLGTFASLLVLGLYLAHSSPAMFSNTMYLGGLIFLQFILFAVWNFRRLFFLFLMIGFLWAGLKVPLAIVWISGRWVLLAIGAAVGVLVYLSEPQHRFGGFHFVAAFAVMGAAVSAFVSDAPSVSLLKAASLFLLFLYAACGGRAAIVGREVLVVATLLTSAEVIALATALFYVFGLEVWGNPNSLGLAMAILSPVLLWGILLSDSRQERSRRLFAFVLVLTLLVWSNSRASVVASATSMAVLCFSLGKKRLLIQGAAAAVCLLSVLAIMAPSKLNTFLSESQDNFVYKGHRQDGVLGSRRGPWQETMDSVRQHPWFGTGFGTSAVEENQAEAGVFASNTATTREHGNSYLAILEWAGVVGVIPFYALVLVIFRRVLQTIRWVYHTNDARHTAIPVMLILLAGLVHAGFEDWLFAVGYYMTVFFWTLAFSFLDFAPKLARASAAWPSPAVLPPAFRTATR